jgi:prophage regulatory protein
VEAALKQRALPTVTPSGDPFTLNNGAGPVSPRPRAITLISYRGLKARGIDYSRSHLWRLEAAGRFPKRVHVGSGRVSWIEHEVDEYLLGLAAARNTTSAPSNMVTAGTHAASSEAVWLRPDNGQPAHGCRGGEYPQSDRVP